MRTPAVFALLLAIAVAASCGCAPQGRVASGTARERDRVASNIERRDYAGSAACAPCHEGVYRAWLGSPMHRMTRAADQAEIRAPFDGATFRFKDDVLTLDRRGAERFIAIESARGRRVYRVTRVIGGRHREDFAGVEVDAPGGRAIGRSNEELVLPASYVFDPPSFRLKGYSVMSHERPSFAAGPVWNQTCIFCHNTVPYLSAILGGLYGDDAPSFQGEIVDPLLPRARRASFVVTDEAREHRAVQDELSFLDAPAEDAGTRALLARAIRATRGRFSAEQLVELGIGCESCHGGGRAHAEDPSLRPSFAIESRWVHAAASPWEEERRASERARTTNRVCARCHQVLFSRYPFTWEGGERRRDPGGSHISSGEARDFLLGSCSTQMTCTDCHDPHAADPAERLAAFDLPSGNATCTRCHATYAEARALSAHTHHAADGAGSACASCHMPRKNLGLSYELVRYHRIGSPNDPARVEGDRPLDCALCHARASVGELVGAMERWWGRRYDRRKLETLYGYLGAPALLATLERGKPHEQATAIGALGSGRVAEALTAVAAQVENPYPLVRYFARRALEQIAGEPANIDPDQDGETVAQQTRAWLARRGLQGSAIPSAASPP